MIPLVVAIVVALFAAWLRWTRRDYDRIMSTPLVDQDPKLSVTYSDPTAWMTAQERRFHTSDQFGR